ncbi:DUF4350 domain-containing protein [Streptomyces sp. Ru73]|uniref:DUF4350 domain-containing protein n=1 Tax=Streptomyces sp. Ru73 TaxID=2080748 RepID=UPI000CDD3D5E|nr:DUF4350 domain-containing protein [Streptomyces sp. Ru73]POX37072.1 DUF4350 domain-containing protein [Streptomyces sp. Ru73]
MTAPAYSTSVSPTAARIWSRSRGLLIALLVLALGGIVIAALRSGEQHGRLDPRSADPAGSRALATLLSERGVSTRVVTSTREAAAAAGPDTTLLVTDPNLLTGQQLDTLRTATGRASGRTVLLAPDQTALDSLAPGIRTATETDVTVRAPDCTLPAARRAGDADLGGMRYSGSAPGAEGCYPVDGLPTLLRLPGKTAEGTQPPGGTGPTAGDTVLLGAPDLLYNHRLAERGNASLALQLLGSHRHLVWYLPSVSDPATARDGERSFLDLIPSGWGWGLLQLAIAAVLTALWRARRLGPLVPERLPVTVPAAETTEGRARLYQQANARDQAAAVLRSATRTRLAPLVGVPPLHVDTADVLVPAVATRLTADGGTPAALHTLLFGPAPADDKALVRLADQLDDLERSILHQERHAPREHPDS